MMQDYRSMLRWASFLMVVGVLGGCTVRNAKSCGDGVCSDPDRPYCDVDGALSGEPGTCVAVTCKPSEFVGCDGDTALSCSASGDGIIRSNCEGTCDPELGCNECVAGTSTCEGGAVVRCGGDGKLQPPEPCMAGCLTAPEAHCAYLEPKYLPDLCDMPAADDEFVVAIDTTLNLDDDANCNGGVITQPDGPALCVLRYDHISIKPSSTLRLSGVRAAALVADSSVTVEGTLDLGARGTNNGPGGGSTYGTGLPGSSGGAQTGGGGTGARAPGGNGGACCTAGTGGGAAGGDVSPAPNSSTVLRGGGGGSKFGSGALAPRNGGGGGGAATLIACRGTVSVPLSGMITANGGGAKGSVYHQSGITLEYTHVPAGGGGAGGSIVLQGLRVAVAGSLFANGGSGGAGRNVDRLVGGDGADGKDGLSSISPATGAAGSNGAGSGGAGGFVGVAPQGGGRVTSTSVSPGGGGGSVGFLEVHVPASGTSSISPVAASPAIVPHQTSSTR